MRVFIRTLGQLNVAREPFKNSKIRGADLNIILLADNLEDGSRAELTALRTKTDGFRVCGREIYRWRRMKPGTTLFSTVPLARILRVPFRIRGTNTIRKVVAKWP